MNKKWPEQNSSPRPLTWRVFALYPGPPSSFAKAMTCQLSGPCLKSCKGQFSLIGRYLERFSKSYFFARRNLLLLIVKKTLLEWDFLWMKTNLILNQLVFGYIRQNDCLIWLFMNKLCDNIKKKHMSQNWKRKCKPRMEGSGHVEFASFSLPRNVIFHIFITIGSICKLHLFYW